MRPFDEIVRLYGEQDQLAQRYALLRSEDLALDFELADLVDFLGDACANPDPRVRQAAHRSYRRAIPAWRAYRYTQRRESASIRGSGTWTSYSLDLSTIARLQDLAEVRKMDPDALDVPRLIASAHHVLQPCLVRAAALARGGAPEHRRMALQALGQLDDPAGLEAVSAALGEPKFAMDAAAALAATGSEGALDALLKALGRYRGTPLFDELLLELRGFRYPRAFDALLAELPKAGPELKVTVAEALKDFKRPESEQALLKLLDEGERTVQLFALEALGRVGSAAAAERVAAAWKGAPAVLVRLAALRTLGAQKAGPGAAVVREGLKDVAPPVRAQALESLARLGLPDGEVAALATPLLDDPDPSVKANAALALSRVDATVALRHVSSMVRKTEAPLRAHGAFCLGYLQNEAGLHALQGFLETEVREVVTMQAVKALAKYPPPQAMPVLLATLSHPHLPVRRTAARILARPGYLGTTAAANRVAQCIRAEKEPLARTELIAALAALGDPSQYLMVSKFLSKEDHLATAATVEALDLLAPIECVPAVKPYLQSPNPEVKARAALALWNQGEVKVVETLAADLDAAEPAKVLGGLKGLFAIGLSLRSLGATRAKYPLLVSSLTKNQKAADYAAYEQKSGLSRFERLAKAPPQPPAAAAGGGGSAFDFDHHQLPDEPAGGEGA